MRMTMRNMLSTLDTICRELDEAGCTGRLVAYTEIKRRCCADENANSQSESAIRQRSAEACDRYKALKRARAVLYEYQRYLLKKQKQKKRKQVFSEVFRLLKTLGRPT